MQLKNIVIDVNSTFGVLKFKRISRKLFKYDSENKRTDELIGFKVLVESVKLRDVFEIKIYNDSIDNYRYLVTNEAAMYDYELGFDNLDYNAYVFKGKLYEVVSADDIAFCDSND